MSTLWLVGCSMPVEKGPPRELLDWAEGPVRWYLLPAEKRALREVESPVEAVNFIERFWGLRDPDRSTGTNEFREKFNQRVEAADLLYSETELRGSLSPRGRALLVLGPPFHMRVASEPALSWSDSKKKEGRTTTREVGVEVWRYRPEELPARLRAALPDEARDDGIELKFRVGSQTTQLIEGGSYLTLAARIVLVQD